GPFHVYIPLERASAFRAALADLDPADRIRWRRYRIADGDSLSTIAARFGTSVQALKEVNKLRSSRIRAGRELLVPPAESGVTTTASIASASASPARAQVQPQRSDHIVHIVQRGNTLWDLARLYGTSSAAIAELNGIRKDTVLRLNQELKITSQLPDEDNNGRQRVAYKVRRGDSLWTISRRFNVSVEDLQRWNQLSRRAYLLPGQRLDVYVIAVSADDV
ncbi:MAG: LysM peptidoglycan-binding domain-containing protein, partial [Gammaproteobacteria bacterium]|nr:LysM peptidoglycan-binding domain-containing protein [Gammaproteobacteria bacterium]